MTLYINSCIRENSRTHRIARALLDKLGGEYTELKLADENLAPHSRESLEKRMELTAAKDFSSPVFDYAKQFAAADIIVISAPFWDLSFPALLKTYIENIYVIGLVSDYDEKGQPHGLCLAKKLYYVTTAGGRYVPDFSYGYIKGLSEYLGIKETRLIAAEMLDVQGFSAEKILEDAIKNLEV